MADLRVISEQSEQEIQRQRCIDELDSRLRILAANVLRIIRGAGSPWELLTQMQACIDVAVDYRASQGCYPSEHEIASPLALFNEPERIYARATSNEMRERWWADGTRSASAPGM